MPDVTWKDAPAAMNAKAHTQRFLEAMAVNRRPRELMMLPADWRPALMPARAIVEIKYDGIHAGYGTGMLDGATAFTREGVPFHACDHLLPALGSIDDELHKLYGQRFMLFGEYVRAEGFEAALRDFAAGTGTGFLRLFDAVSVDAWRGRVPSPPLHQRQAMMRRAIDRVPSGVLGMTGAVKSSLFTGEARDNIEVAVGDLWAQGLEGVVVKDADSPYVRAKSSFWQRIKRQETTDARIIAVNVKGGTVRSFSIENGNGLVCNVAAGISDALRADPDAFRLGRLVELKHLGRTGSGSLRSPSFLRFRDDKES